MLAAPDNEDLRVDHDTAFTFIIGDAQGRSDLLTKMFAKIENNPSHLPFAANDKVVILGNYIHETGNMYDLLQVLKDYKFRRDEQVVLLRGRTEQRLLKFKKNFFTSPIGKNLIDSYRYKPVNTRPYGVNWKDPDKIEAVALQRDLNWLAKRTSKYYETDKFFVCSAGVNPNLTLDEQYLNSLMCLGNSMKGSEDKLTKRIIHGHTYEGVKPKIGKKRISLNTNVSENGVLYCTVMNNKTGEVEEIIQVTSD